MSPHRGSDALLEEKKQKIEKPKLKSKKQESPEHHMLPMDEDSKEYNSVSRAYEDDEDSKRRVHTDSGNLEASPSPERPFGSILN